MKADLAFPRREDYYAAASAWFKYGGHISLSLSLSLSLSHQQEFMYLGSFPNASSRQVIDHLKITHVVNITDDCPSTFDEELKVICVWKKE